MALAGFKRTIGEERGEQGGGRGDGSGGREN